MGDWSDQKKLRKILETLFHENFREFMEKILRISIKFLEKLNEIFFKS